MQKWHHNHEDIYLKSNNVQENNLISLWVPNVIHLTASPCVRLLAFYFYYFSGKSVWF